ncbi:MAG TPA: YqgE/AlgH family protein [Acidimicrobiales bacterium]|nr:YqgE/AlgH family protein [Acidimicrobiales bacterium]
MREPTPGCLLVANPLLPDGNFDRTVVLVLARNEDGALGVVLNRDGPTRLGSALPGWAPLASDPPVIFAGGPVNTDAVICLARTLEPADRPGWSQVTRDLATVDLDLDPAAVADQVSGLRVFAGYAGWGPGQLESEIEAEAWWVLDGKPADAFTSDPAQLWASVLRRQGGSLQLVASYPDDPSAN